MANASDSPCLSCGACCAAFRVSFYWGEAASDSYAVPLDLIEAVTPFRGAMRGTNQQPPRCVALTGQVGEAVSCAIYHHRPSPCREFTAGDERCLEARARYGLPPPANASLVISHDPGHGALVSPGKSAMAVTVVPPLLH